MRIVFPIGFHPANSVQRDDRFDLFMIPILLIGTLVNQSHELSNKKVLIENTSSFLFALGDKIDL